MEQRMKSLVLILTAFACIFSPCLAENIVATDPGAGPASPSLENPLPVGPLYEAFPYGGKPLGPPPPATWPVLGASYSDYLPSAPAQLNASDILIPMENASVPVQIGPCLQPEMASGGHAPVTLFDQGFPGEMSHETDSHGGQMPASMPFPMHGPPPMGYPPGMMPGGNMASFPGMPFHPGNASFPGMALDPNDPCWGPCKQAAYDSYIASANGIPQPPKQPSEGSGAKVTTATFIALVQSQIKMMIVDTRTGALDDGKRIPGAISLSPDATPDQIDAALPQKSILVVTYSGHAGEDSASRLADRLRGMGFLNVIEYRDGFTGWLNSGMKVESKKQ